MLPAPPMSHRRMGAADVRSRGSGGIRASVCPDGRVPAGPPRMRLGSEAVAPLGPATGRPARHAVVGACAGRSPWWEAHEDAPHLRYYGWRSRSATPAAGGSGGIPNAFVILRSVTKAAPKVRWGSGYVDSPTRPWRRRRNHFRGAPPYPQRARCPPAPASRGRGSAAGSLRTARRHARR